MSECRNYHSLPTDEVLKHEEVIRWWLFNNPTHPQLAKAEMALRVIQNTLELRRVLSEEGQEEYSQVVKCILDKNSDVT